jgi:hypothetical protein
MKKTFIFLLLLLIRVINGYSQIPEEPTRVLTPNAASLGLYGDIPVSLYTGTPEISIPLYEIKVDDFTLPISLNYHASGVRVDQHPGWVGLGWSLFAGGVITRQRENGIDESDGYAADGNNVGYFLTKPFFKPTIGINILILKV